MPAWRANPLARRFLRWIAPAGFARLSIVAINLLALGFIGLAVWQTIASWSSDLVEGRRRLRVFIVTAASLYGGMNAILQILVSGKDAAVINNTASSAVLACVVAAISSAMMRVDGADHGTGEALQDCS